MIDLARQPEIVRRAMGLRGKRWAFTHMHAESLAAWVVNAVEGTYGRTHASFGKFGCAAIGAVWDVAGRRSARILAGLYDDRIMETVNRAFDQWLRDANTIEKDVTTTPLHPLPRILSPRLAASGNDAMRHNPLQR